LFDVKFKVLKQCS